MADIASALVALLGADQVVAPIPSDHGLVLALAQATDGDLPAAIAYPTTEAQLGAVLALAHGHGWRVLPCGSGSKLAWGGLAPAIDVVVSTEQLNQIIDHAVGDMTLTVEAGLKLGDLRPILAQQQQFLALDPAYPDQATLGGIVATADAGALRQRYGGVRDMLIGISFVRADGQIAKAGGRVVKNVAGYDLMKLMTGAYGTLGVISQLTFRLYPMQDVSKTVVVAGTAMAIESLVATLRLSSLTPVAMDIFSPALAAKLGLERTFALVVRFQSIAPGVEEQVDQLLSLVAPELTTQVITGPAEIELWQRAKAAIFPSPGSSEAPLAVVAKLGVRPAAVMAVLDKFLALMPADSLVRFHAGSGIGTLRLAAEGVNPDLITSLRGHCTQAGGYLTLLEGPKSLKQTVEVWGYQGSGLTLMQKIKAQFDPHSQLSPGRFVGGI